MFAELVVNIDAPLDGTFHYDVPRDLALLLRVGQLVEVEFGQRLAQGIVVAFSDVAPVEETKPVINLIDAEPVVRPWQIALARWMSAAYLAPLNACLRLMLPPGLTSMSDITLDISPHWDGSGRLTEQQQALIALLRERGDLRGRQISRLLGERKAWPQAANQLVKRGILRRATVLDPPRARPKTIRTAELTASWSRALRMVAKLGRASKQADILTYLSSLDDPLPAETAVLAATGAQPKHMDALVAAALVTRTPGQTLIVRGARADAASATAVALLAQLPADRILLDVPDAVLDDLAAQEIVQAVTVETAVNLAVSEKAALHHILALRSAETYYRVLSLLADAAQPLEIGDIYARTGATINHLRRLARLDLIRFGAEEVWRDPLADRDFVAAEPPRLTEDQARAWGRIKVAMIDAAAEEEAGGAPDAEQEDDPVLPETAPPVPFLLHGVTGSGKTEVYMRAIDFTLAQGQQAVVLVPEIALTPQTVRRFAARFPGRVAVLHSRLTAGERYDTWRRARQGLFDIVVGPRSALFTPFERPGVIVVDEEHDPSYKQTAPVLPPFYHARDTAIELGRLTGAAVIMGSATPDVATYHRARGGRYTLLEMPRRVMGHRQRIESQATRLHLASRYEPFDPELEDALTIPLPPIQVVDLRQELRAGNRSIFSRALDTAVTETLARGEQAILFLNRRGTSTFVFCRDCGHVMKCPRCDMPLTYHRPRMQLVCHHCGRREPNPSACPQCGSRRIRHFGLGTEEVESQVAQRWPAARITRWDRDTTAGRDTHEALLASFIDHEADILVGTQMIAKGLDLPFVTLVGVINADVALGLPDYRTAERAFQILAQVAGRAGRGLLGGRVIVQTYKPEHYAIQAAAEHDYASFYIEEIRFRTQLMLPPFRRMAKLVLMEPVQEHGREEAERLAKGLRLHSRELALSATEILGPVPPFFSRVDGRYRWQIIVRSPDPVRLLADFPVPRPWLVEIDPVDTL